MKHKGKCKSEFIDSRNENLRREFLERLGKNGRSLGDIFKDIASSAPADRFYISEERAQRVVGELNHPRDRAGGRKRHPRLEMAEELQRRVNALRQTNPRMSLREAVFQVVNSPAPAFYLSPNTIRTILYENHKANRS